MIALITGVAPDPEDPRSGALSDEFEEAAPSNQYLSKKDIKYIGAGLLLLAIVFFPVYIRLKKDKERYTCGLNFKAISTAMSTYMADNDDCFPPTFVRDADTPYPRVDADNRPITWASTLAGLAGFDTARYSFTCPSADPKEVMIAEGPQGTDLPMAYGMYEAFDTADRRTIASPGSSVLVAETANDGANQTFDPKPMPAKGGRVSDGFLIGWSTGDIVSPPNNIMPPPSVTRIAVQNSPNGLGMSLYANGRVPESRHDDRIYVLFADGHYSLVKVAYLLNAKAWTIPPR